MKMHAVVETKIEEHYKASKDIMTLRLPFRHYNGHIKDSREPMAELLGFTVRELSYGFQSGPSPFESGGDSSSHAQESPETAAEWQDFAPAATPWPRRFLCHSDAWNETPDAQYWHDDRDNGWQSAWSSGN